MKGDFRGKCHSTHGKVSKTGELKHAGNFSASTYRAQHVQVKDYYVRVYTFDSGIQQLMVGHTPLAEILGEEIAHVALTNEKFSSISLEFTRTIAGKNYEVYIRLRKSHLTHSWAIDPHAFIMRYEVYTDDDKFTFPEY